ncbi:DUF2164 domain-containing protein [Paenibacillus sacheonensis]|uniref:DUF2164 family protein n=1 Tax=Paenibacillus sacheonensis TaxID=742054 RepID=A0A7X4YMY3_9BACL|nr:DUF2164 domain-containing protein [Paenibacillus sacheonensis]MBM7564724.1 uncharacterized protein (DUF2164 family) [Paenibacillus sacheonensis]NBC69280.1 DUF2164 family protein [Paenibacillus sacheonensis]
MLNLKLPREEKENLIQSVQAYFEEERSESIGSIGAEALIDFMLKELGPYAYNQALADARKAIQDRAAQLEDDLYGLEKPIRHLR